jgi:mono/diheme cytochrome c family protein
MKPKRFAGLAVIAAAAAYTQFAADAQPKPTGDAQAGRAFALDACTGCHIVAADQPFKPVYAGTFHPPDFEEIANKPSMTAASLINYLDTLPTIPNHPHMANADLTPGEARDVAAYILSLRGKP